MKFSEMKKKKKDLINLIIEELIFDTAGINGAKFRNADFLKLFSTFTVVGIPCCGGPKIETEDFRSERGNYFGAQIRVERFKFGVINY